MTSLEGAITPTERAAPEIMCAEQLAVFLGLNRKTVYEYAARGLIPHRRIGRRLRFARVHVLAWLDDVRWPRSPGIGAVAREAGFATGAAVATSAACKASGTGKGDKP